MQATVCARVCERISPSRLHLAGPAPQQKTRGIRATRQALIIRRMPMANNRSAAGKQALILPAPAIGFPSVATSIPKNASTIAQSSRSGTGGQAVLPSFSPDGLEALDAKHYASMPLTFQSLEGLPSSEVTRGGKERPMALVAAPYQAEPLLGVRPQHGTGPLLFSPIGHCAMALARDSSAQQTTLPQGVHGATQSRTRRTTYRGLYGSGRVADRRGGPGPAFPKIQRTRR